MFIEPMQTLGSIRELREHDFFRPAENHDVLSSFRSILQEAVENVKETDKKVQNNNYLLATGQVDNLHNVMIDNVKAQMSVEMLVQLRNKALESYNELMRINL